MPLDWAMTQNNLGNALRTLGERKADTVHLEEAVDAYRAALEVFTGEGSPRYRGLVQDNLVRALNRLRERGSQP